MKNLTQKFTVEYLGNEVECELTIEGWYKYVLELRMNGYSAKYNMDANTQSDAIEMTKLQAKMMVMNTLGNYCIINRQ